MKRLLLIDANSLIHRSFHALPPLTTPEGQPIQSIYGISNILTKLWREDKPDYAAALFDRPEPTFRKEKYVEYKAQRPKAPDELISQIIEAHNLFKEFGIKTFEKPGFEADDGIATLTEKFRKEPNLQVMILTGDLDTLQLVEDEKVVVRTFKKGISDTMVYDRNAVIERYGLPPEKLIEYKALVGDPSDNIKGISGVGPKTAAELIKKYGTLKDIYKNTKTDPKLLKKLGDTETAAEFMKELVTLYKEVPLEIKKLEELRVEDGISHALPYFKKLGFRNLVERIEGAPKKSDVVKEEAVLKDEDFDGALFITENINFIHGDFRSAKLKIGFGLKSLIKESIRQEREFLPPYFDLGLAYWLLDPDLKDYEPDMVSQKFLKKEWRGGEEDLKNLYVFAKLKLKEYNLLTVFNDIETPLLRILAEMEEWGIQVEREVLKEMERKINKDLLRLTQEVYGDAGEVFNLNSPQQLGRILFEKLAILKKPKKTPGGQFTTSFETLEELKDVHPVINRILEYRELFKLQSTYIKPLQELPGEDGRLHTDFIQTGAATGRLSSKAPNMQNIPKGSPWADELRSAFTAQQGYLLLACDYSQLELRILASLCEDPKMTEAFQKNQDIHNITAARVLGKPIDKINPKDRQLAKTLNFGLIYGMGVTAFAKTSRLTRDEAQKFIDSYFSEFSRVREWHEEIKRDARTYGYVQTLTGRRRYVPGIISSSPRLRSEAERIAINQPVQGLEADLLKLAMIGIRDSLTKKGYWGSSAKLLLSIHDELLFEVRGDMMEEIATEAKNVMEKAYPLRVPLRVDVSAAKDWGHMKKILF